MFLTPQFRFAIPHGNTNSMKKESNLSCRRAFQDRCVNTVNSRHNSQLQPKQLLKPKINLFKTPKQNASVPKEDDTPAWMYEMTVSQLDYQLDVVSVKAPLSAPLTPPPSPGESDMNEMCKDLPTPKPLDFGDCFQEDFLPSPNIDNFSRFDL